MNFLYTHIDYVISVYVPIYTVKKSLYPEWFSRELTLVKTKKTAHCKYKTTNYYLDYLEFIQLRAQCKNCSLKCWRDYARKSECAIADNVKVFWNFFNSLRKINKLPSHVFHNNIYIDNSSIITNCFADYFESVYSMDDSLNGNLKYDND